MPEPGKIEIKIATTGADAAAADLKKVATAAQEATAGGAKTSRYTGADDLIAQMDAMKERAAAAEKEAAAIGKIREEAEAAAPKLEKLINFERLESLGRMGREFERMGKEIGKLNPELEQSGRSLTMLGGTMTGFAEGMRMGGPMGGGIGAIIGAFAEPLKTAFEDMSRAEERAAESAKKANESFTQLQKARENHAAHTISVQAIEDLDKETEALKEWIKAYELARKVRQAESGAAESAAQLDDEKRVAAGANPQAVEIQAARRQAEAKKQEEDAALDKERQRYARLKDKSDTAGSAWYDYQLNPSKVKDDKETERLRKAAEDTSKATYDQADVVVAAEKTAAANKRRIDDDAERKVIRLQQEQARQDEANDRRKADEAIRAKQKRDAEAERERKGRENLGRDAVGAGDQAGRLGLHPDAVAKLDQAAQQLQADPSRGNQKKVLDLLDRLLGWVDQNNKNNDAQLNALKTKVQAIENREKNNRQ